MNPQTVTAQPLVGMLAGFGAIVILWQLARLGWGIVSQAALWLYMWRHHYDLEVADRLRRYV